MNLYTSLLHVFMIYNLVEHTIHVVFTGSMLLTQHLQNNKLCNKSRIIVSVDGICLDLKTK